MQARKIIDHIVLWLNDYCETAGLDGFVVGVSGGIDSAVTSLATRACGKSSVLTLPLTRDRMYPDDPSVGMKFDTNPGQASIVAVKSELASVPRKDA